MSKLQKIENVLSALLLFCCAAVMIAHPDKGFYLAACILSVTLILNGLRTLIYYFTMAVHSVGGKIQLYKGIILMDLGLFVLMLDDVPHIYVVLYLVGYNLIAGAIGILRSFESKKNGGRWKLKLSEGIFYILIAVLCLIFNSSVRMMVYIYSAGLIYSACVRMADAFRKTAIVYIQ